MAKIWKWRLILVALVVLGLAIRVVVVPVINKGDVVVNGEWARNLYKGGLQGSYFRPGWTYSFPTQPPLMMLSFWASEWLFDHRYVLAISHNAVKLPPAGWLTWLDKNGESLVWRWWGIWGDLLTGVLLYWMVKQREGEGWLAVLGAAAVILNPVTIFVSGVWGQNDMWGVFWLFLAFWVAGKRWGWGISPLFLMVGVMMKPTVLVLAPVYLVYVARQIWRKGGRREIIFRWVSGGLAALMVGLAAFLPFWEKSESFFDFVPKVMEQRVLPSAKGVSRASASAFNFYSLMFDLDNTPGSYQMGGISLDRWGTGMGVLLVGVVVWMMWRRTRGGIDWLSLCFLIYVLGEGLFLFKTNMLERYFFPVFPAFLMLVVGEKSKLRWLFVGQCAVWLVNLIYAFFWRDVAGINWWFRENGFLMSRLFSLINLVIYGLVLAEVFGRKGKEVRLMGVRFAKMEER